MTPPTHPAPEIAEVVAEMRAAADCGPDESILPSWLLATADRLESLVSGAADTAQRRYENQSKGWRNAPPWDELNADAKQLWIEHAARFPQALAQHSPATGEGAEAYRRVWPDGHSTFGTDVRDVGGAEHAQPLYVAPPTPTASEPDYWIEFAIANPDDEVSVFGWMDMRMFETAGNMLILKDGARFVFAHRSRGAG